MCFIFTHIRARERTHTHVLMSTFYLTRMGIEVYSKINIFLEAFATQVTWIRLKVSVCPHVRV